MAYRFRCRHCGSQFSLEQQLQAHEAECGKVGTDIHDTPARPAGEVKKCKYCEETFANFGEYGAHRWAAHREQVLAELARKREQRKTDEKKIDASIKGNGHGAGAAPSAPRRSAPARVPTARTDGVTCPTCGGILPARTAEFVHELAAAGIPEAQAFEAARIARRVLLAGAA